MQQSVTGVTTNAPTPADGDDYTWEGDSLTYAALVRTVYRLQNEIAGLAAQVVEFKSLIQKIVDTQTLDSQNGLTQVQVLQHLAAQVVELRERLDRQEADS